MLRCFMGAQPKVWNEECITKELDRIKSRSLTIDQVAALLQVSHITVRRWIKEVKLIAWNTSASGCGRWRIPREGLEEFLQSRNCMNID